MKCESWEEELTRRSVYSLFGLFFLHETRVNLSFGAFAVPIIWSLFGVCAPAGFAEQEVM